LERGFRVAGPSLQLTSIEIPIQNKKHKSPELVQGQKRKPETVLQDHLTDSPSGGLSTGSWPSISRKNKKPARGEKIFPRGEDSLPSGTKPKRRRECP